MNGFVKNIKFRKSASRAMYLLLTLLVSPHINAATESSVVVGGKEIPLKSFLSRVKIFDRNHKESWALELDPQFIAAYNNESSALNDQNSSSSHHKDAAIAYGAATAYTAAIGRGVSSSGIAHMGLNLLLGSEEANLKKKREQQLLMLRSTRILISKNIDVQTPEEAFYKSIEELSAFLPAMCPVGPSERKGMYQNERWLFMPVECKEKKHSAYFDIRNVKLLPALFEQGMQGFLVKFSIPGTAWGEGMEIDNRESYIKKIKEAVPSDWYIQYSDLSDETYVVSQNEREVRFPLPAAKK